MREPARIDLLQPSDEREFLAAARRSGALHRPWVSPPQTPTAFRALVKRQDGVVNTGFVVRRRDDGAIAGYIGLSNVVRGLFQSGYLGYYGFAGMERQGLMASGVRLVVRHAFRSMKLHRLEANIQPGNVASIALVKACGFLQEGYSPRYLKIGGRWRDHERWAILAH